VKLNEEKFGRLKLPLTFATRFKKAKVLQRVVVKISKQNRFFLLLKSIKKVEINEEKFGRLKLPLTFATRFEKSESSSKGLQRKFTSKQVYSSNEIS
jgi:hypothetical protein